MLLMMEKSDVVAADGVFAADGIVATYISAANDTVFTDATADDELLLMP